MHLETYLDDSVATSQLKAITNTCDLAKLSLSNSDQPTSDTDSSDDDVSDDGHGPSGADRIAEKVKVYTHCLLDLSAALECPAPDAERAELVAVQPWHDPLSSTEETNTTLRPSGLNEWFPLWPSRKDLPGNPWLYVDDTTQSDSVPALGSSTRVEPSVVSSSMSTTKLMGVTTRRRSVTQFMAQKEEEFQKRNRNFQCPFRRAQAKQGLPYTCTAGSMSTVSAVRTHLTRKLPRAQLPHLPFLKLCPVCNTQILDQSDFETLHGHDGLKCENPRPRRRGDIGQQEQYDILCAKVEAYIAAQEDQKGTYLPATPKEYTNTDMLSTTYRQSGACDWAFHESTCWKWICYRVS
jgi:hypothetical protein